MNFNFEMQEKVTMEGLSSKDVIQLIGVHLNDPFDIFALGMCCKHFCECLLQKDSEPMWRKLVLLEESNDEEAISWKEKYISRKVCFLNFDAVVAPKRDDFFGKIGSLFKSKKVINVAVVGLAGSGKTTVLKSFYGGHFKKMHGTGTCYVTYKKRDFALIEVNSMDVLLKSKGFEKLDAVIFVVDSNERDSLKLASEKIMQVLADPRTSGRPALFYAHKQDLPNACSVAEVTDKLGLHSLRWRKWYIQSSATILEGTGDGIMEGLDWLCYALPKNRP